MTDREKVNQERYDRLRKPDFQNIYNSQLIKVFENMLSFLT